MLFFVALIMEEGLVMNEISEIKAYSGRSTLHGHILNRGKEPIVFFIPRSQLVSERPPRQQRKASAPEFRASSTALLPSKSGFLLAQAIVTFISMSSRDSLTFWRDLTEQKKARTTREVALSYNSQEREVFLKIELGRLVSGEVLLWR